MTILSGTLCCLGMNFEQEWVVKVSLLFVPYSFLLIRFCLAIFQMNIQDMKESYLRIMVISLTALLVGILYYALTPYSHQYTYPLRLSHPVLPFYFVLIILSFLILVSSRKDELFIKYIFNYVTGWLIYLIAMGYYIQRYDWINVWRSALSLKLVFFCIFLGLGLYYLLTGMAKKETISKIEQIVSKTLIGIILVFGTYFIAIDIRQLTTRYNVEKYVYNELSSKNFTVNTIDIDLNTKEVFVYYIGLKPSMAQDESIKKSYHIDGYHFEYKEIK